MSESALAGIRVIETANLSAAFAGRLLADMGAEVWKIEQPAGDPSRRTPPFSKSDPAESRFFTFYNSGKRSLIADPESPGDRESLRRLFATADVWLDSTPPGQPSPWRLDPGELTATNPRLVFASVTPFGLSGLYASFTATDLIAQAAGGMVFTNGFPGETPLQGFGLQAYHSASAYALIGILLALIERRRSGRGQTIDVSLQEAVAGALEETSAAWNGERRIEIRRGPVHWTRVFRTCRCRDGYVMICLIGDWTTLQGWLMERGEGAHLTGPEWDDFYHRRDRSDELYAIVDRWARDQTAEEILEGAQLRRLPFAAVRPPEALLEDPQLAAREFFAKIPDTGLRFPGPPFVMSRTPLRTRASAPALASSSWPVMSPPHPDPLPKEEIEDTRLFPLGRGRRDAPGEGELPRRILDGIRILDFTHVVAGPVATRILADHGAEVIKIERTKTLDLGERRGGFFGNLNRGKKSLILNLSDPRGVELARQLAAISDVVVDNFSARVMGNWGLDYEGLRKLRADIIAIGMSGFGKTGPLKDYVSFGPTLQALSGHTMIMRHPGGEPAGWGFSHSDICAGQNGAIAILAALHHRRETGEGQFIDLSQLESVTAFMGPVLLDMANNGTIPEPPGNRSQEAPGAPHGVYRSAGDDRWLALSILDDETWRRFAAAVAEPWARDARFQTHRSRLQHARELDRAIESWTSQSSPEEVTLLLQNAGVPAFTVANGEDLCARDPHLQQRGYWTRVPTPEDGFVILDGVPSRLAETPGFVAAPGPLHGEHTDLLLRQALGLSGDEIRRLRADRVVG